MTDNYKVLCECVDFIRTRTQFVPKAALVLGSGLGFFAENIRQECCIDYSEIPGFPISTNLMHRGRFVMGFLEDTPVIIMEGRIHYYEGYSMDEVVMPIRIMHMLGAKTLLVTNAAGGINDSFTPGDLMVITDHISSFVPSPLIGKNIEELGTRFPDMSNVYKPEFTDIIKNAACELNIPLKEGVYLQTTGPNYETPAEIRFYRSIGADAVGMSTACEAMAAMHCGMNICGISCITNMAAGMTSKPLDDKEVGLTAKASSDYFSELLYKIIPLIV